jgi:hypothetical protein
MPIPESHHLTISKKKKKQNKKFQLKVAVLLQNVHSSMQYGLFNTTLLVMRPALRPRWGPVSISPVALVSVSGSSVPLRSSERVVALDEDSMKLRSISRLVMSFSRSHPLICLRSSIAPSMSRGRLEWRFVLRYFTPLSSVKLHVLLWRLWRLCQDAKDSKDTFFPKTGVFR